MASSIDKQMERTFPLKEAFKDASGQTRQFRISMRKLVTDDFFIDATEIPREGYRFQVYSTIYSAAAVGLALGKLREKIRRGLATRYLCTDEKGQQNLTHDELSGRISHNGIVVDGTLLQFGNLEQILTTHEGFLIQSRSVTRLSKKVAQRAEADVHLHYRVGRDHYGIWIAEPVFREISWAR